MKAKDRDIRAAKRILREISEVNEMLANHTEEQFLSSIPMQKATVMSLLNIGEQTKAFTDDFIDATAWIPWEDMRAARNIAAHTYDALDMRDVWETYRADLPALRKEMTNAISRLENGWNPAQEAANPKHR